MLQSAFVKRGLAIVLGVAALGIWGLFLLVAGPDDAFRRPSADGAATEELEDDDEQEPSAPEPSPAEPSPTEPDLGVAPSAVPRARAPAPGPAPDPTPPAPEPTEPEPVMADPPGRGGPVDELRRAYDSSSADSGAAAAETLIRGLFGAEELPRELMRSVSCHRSVCKVQMVWTREHPLGVMALGMLLGQRMSSVIAIDPAGEPDRHGEVPLDIYTLREGYEVDDLDDL